MIPVTSKICIRESELKEEFVRSPGPGGQNVNKVSTAVLLSFDASSSPSLPEEVRRRLLALAGRRADSAGIIRLRARRHRSQERNRAEARRRLVELIRQAAEPRRPRHRTRPTPQSRLRRRAAKSRRGQIKRSRRIADHDLE